MQLIANTWLQHNTASYHKRRNVHTNHQCIWQQTTSTIKINSIN